MSCTKISGCIYEDSTFSCLARVEVNGANWTQAQVASITYKVWINTNEATPVATGTVTIADAVFDTLQTDGRWTVDDTGYNFRHTLPHTTITGTGLHTVEYEVTLVSGARFPLDPFEPNVRNTLTR